MRQACNRKGYSQKVSIQHTHSKQGWREEHWQRRRIDKLAANGLDNQFSGKAYEIER
jgi:hypothetical protein